MTNCTVCTPTNRCQHVEATPANYNDPACNWPNCKESSTKEDNIPGTWCTDHMELIKDDIFPWAFP
ncbi:uncharacterized protein LOC62_03G003984 [Vanrija pseudolonga]|uniref:Uncharacterized protein n=1 Tax=Vanrija pseudolonga TaxID=143232 RepID=A0AAF0Y527_9TREE|nr:hypothetical protein LOC62_03G003984 [Vanrija pseudolonga]